MSFGESLPSAANGASNSGARQEEVDNGQQAPKARSRKPRSPTGKKEQPTWFTAWERLDQVEKDFLRESLKDGDYDRAAKVAGHKRCFDLLGRAHVRSAILAAAPFSESHITAKLLKPYILQKLMLLSISEGDVASSKVLLALDVGEKKAKPVSYARDPSREQE